jgi:hypothetical protein
VTTTEKMKPPRHELDELERAASELALREIIKSLQMYEVAVGDMGDGEYRARSP